MAIENLDIQTSLRKTVADFFQIAPEQVTGGLSFRERMSGSLARARFDVAIRQRLKIVCPEVYTARTYGELEAAVLGKPVAATETANTATSVNAVQTTAPTSNGLAAAMENIACGIDIESPDQFPIEADYWESEFYRANFSRAEIAYCAVQADPRLHFAARWCAKESLKKCDNQYMTLEMNRIEVVLDGTGRPALHCISHQGDNSSRLPVAVSLTHLGAMAAAVVVKLATGAQAVNQSNNKNATTTTQIATTSSRAESQPRRSWWTRLFA